MERFGIKPRNLNVNGENVTQHALDDLFPETPVIPTEQNKPQEITNIIPFRQKVSTQQPVVEVEEKEPDHDDAWRDLGYR